MRTETRQIARVNDGKKMPGLMSSARAEASFTRLKYFFMIHIHELNHVLLNVRDLDASVHFYGTILELPRLPRPAFNFPGAWFAAGKQDIHLIGDPNLVPTRGTITTSRFEWTIHFPSEPYWKPKAFVECRGRHRDLIEQCSFF